jgi:hypothetical protein
MIPTLTTPKNGFIGFVEFIYFTEEVFEFCSIGIDYLLDGRGYHA